MVTAETTTEPVAVPQAERSERSDGGDTVRASWNVSLDDLQKNISNSTPEAQELLCWCFLWCIDDAHPLTLAEFSAKLGSDVTTIGRIIRGKYMHPVKTGERMPISPALTKSLRLFKEMENERSKATRTAFTLTPTAKRIWNACDLARESQSPVFLIGPSHIGKTWALTNYTDENNHGRTIYVRLQAASGLGGMVRAIADGLGLSDKSNTTDLIARIKRALKPNMLLILDEVHQLMYTYRREAFFSCMEVIREFYDAAQCGLVLCGTELLFTKVKNHRSDLEQLLRRGVHKIILPNQPTRGDIAAIVAPLGLEMPEKDFAVTVKVGSKNLSDRPFEMLKQVGKEEGLKSITERLRYGTKRAAKLGTKISWEHVIWAHFTIKQNTVNEDDWN